jgi:hypothetical protein
MSNIEREPNKKELDPDAEWDEMILQQFNLQFEEYLEQMPNKDKKLQTDDLPHSEPPEKPRNEKGLTIGEIPRAV